MHSPFHSFPYRTLRFLSTSVDGSIPEWGNWSAALAAASRNPHSLPPPSLLVLHRAAGFRVYCTVHTTHLSPTPTRRILTLLLPYRECPRIACCVSAVSLCPSSSIHMYSHPPWFTLRSQTFTTHAISLSLTTTLYAIRNFSLYSLTEESFQEKSWIKNIRDVLNTKLNFSIYYSDQLGRNIGFITVKVICSYSGSCSIPLLSSHYSVASCLRLFRFHSLHFIPEFIKTTTSLIFLFTCLCRSQSVCIIVRPALLR